jgi:hypothetical protein
MAIHKDLTGAAALHQLFEHSESDPGSGLGAFKGWLKPSTGEVKIRDSTNSSWILVGTVSSVSPASETTAGIAELATVSETNAGIDDARIVTPAKLTARTAAEDRTGVIEIATQSETDTGTDDARAVTPAKLANYPGLGGGGSADLEGLSDVDLTSPAIRQGLFYDGANFVNQYEPGHFVAPVAVSSSGTVAAGTHTENVNASGGAVTRTLPTAVGIAGKSYVIKKVDSSANVVAVGTTSSQTIDGAAAPWNIRFQNESLEFRSDGANWQIHAESIDLPITDLRDVDAASPAVDDLLTFDGTNWVPIDRASIGAGGGASLSGYTVTNETTDKSYDADVTSVDELADVLGTLINDLSTGGGGGGGGYTPPWVAQSGAGSLFATWRDGDPERFMDANRSGAVNSLTPSNIGTTVIRCSKFRLPKTLSVSNLYLRGQASVSGIYTVAIYPAGTGSTRLWNNGGATLDTVNGWVNLTGGTPFSLSADTDYWLCIGANASGGTAGVLTPLSPTPIDSFWDGTVVGVGTALGLEIYAEFATTAGAMPATLPAVADPSAWASTVPVFMLKGTAS